MILKSLRINYIEDHKGKSKTLKVENLSKEKREFLLKFFEEGIDSKPPEKRGKVQLSLKPILTLCSQQIPSNYFFNRFPSKSSNKTFDVICPVYYANKYFETNVQNWFEELPINTLYLGINNPELKIKFNDPRIEIIDQTHFKTLGACLRDLMERVKTEWFFFLHSDVELLKGSFKIMISKKGFGRGIIESNRLYLHEQTKDLNFLKYIDYNDAIRAYSGYQLIRKKAIEPILAKIDDDYIYRNEDLIFQSECLKNGFEYKKCWALHIHQVLDQKRTFDEYETHVMQVKGLIKYSNPTKINERTLVDPLRWCKVNLKSSYNFTLNEMLRFCYQNNPNWAEIIIREWNK